MSLHIKNIHLISTHIYSSLQKSLCSLYYESIHTNSSSSVQQFRSVGFLVCVLQFELGLFGLHGFGGDLGALRQQRCLLSWSLRLGILQQEVTDEKLQALPQHS